MTTLALVLLAGSTMGCKEIKEKAERVFLRQNQVTSALMDVIMAVEMDDPALAERLYGREAEMNDACAPLQRAGSRVIYDEKVDGSLKMRAFNAIRPCDGKVDEVADLLWEVDPEIATLHLGAREGEGVVTVAAGTTDEVETTKASEHQPRSLKQRRADARINHWYSQGGR